MEGRGNSANSGWQWLAAAKSNMGAQRSETAKIWLC